ncbi:hypothetical protein C8R44DRAFT_734209 [Mycena epipterygia]|nr:hypothetical protein C8R44DRAFT_734209 [Mycena epipterygia]
MSTLSHEPVKWGINGGRQQAWYLVQAFPEPEPELGVQFGPVRVRTDFPNRTLTTLDKFLPPTSMPASFSDSFLLCGFANMHHGPRDSESRALLLAKSLLLVSNKDFQAPPLYEPHDPFPPLPYTPLPMPAAFVSVRPAPRTWTAAIYGNIAFIVRMVFSVAQPVAVESHKMHVFAGGDAV